MHEYASSEMRQSQETIYAYEKTYVILDTTACYVAVMFEVVLSQCDCSLAQWNVDE